MILDETSFSALLTSNKIIFCGSGCKKLQKLVSHDNALFTDSKATAADMPFLAYPSFTQKSFAELAYTEPLYIKEFYSPYRKPLI